LLIDCDSNASASKFYCGAEPPEGLRKVVDDHLTVIWQPLDKTKQQQPQPVGKKEALSREFEYVVIDVDAALEDTVQTLVQSHPDLVLIPVDNQLEALINLKDTLEVIATLEITFGIKVTARVVPMGVDNARVQAIRERIDSLAPLPQEWKVWPRIPDLQGKANLARKNRKYIWNYAGCANLEAYYRKLVTLP